MRSLMACIITYYCKSRDVRYKQGMHEILAPFILLRSPPLTAAELFQMLYATIALYLTKVYAVDDEFVSLQCAFRLFRILMLYHEPALCNLLDQYDVGPELYAMQWFLTLFTRAAVTTGDLLRLWDFLFVHGDPVLVYFVALAFLRSKR